MKNNGSLHPLTQFNRLALQYFIDRSFKILEGDEIESEWYNFDALNVPADHPSRDVQDTFWLAPTYPEYSRGSKVEGLKNKNEVLRTHNTGSELHLIKKLNLKPPFKIVVPGRDFRNERTNLTHEHTFYQIDGIVVDKHINMGYLIGTLEDWMKSIFGKNIKIRTRPHLFPFVEPGLEMDVKLSDGKWREMLGAGMGHPVVLRNMGIDPQKWQAIMWGPGIDRYAMIKYNINDIRKFHAQDLRFLKQF